MWFIRLGHDVISPTRLHEFHPCSRSDVISPATFVLHFEEVIIYMIFVVFRFVIPHFWPFYFVFTRHLKSLYRVISSNFYVLFRDISSVFFSILHVYISAFLSVRFANILLVLSQTFIRLNLIFLSIRFTACHCYFLIFTRFYSLRSLVISDEISAERLLWSTSFGSEGTFFYFIF